jgi:predicted nucleic acid-binding protein
VALENPGWEVVLDDHSARREAMRLSIPCIGTVGLVLTGHRVGTVPSVRDALQSLRDAGLFISDKLLRLAVSEAGE